MPDLETENARLRNALLTALTIIDNYAADIRNSKWTGVDLVARGFCQGSIYRDARDFVERIARGEIDP